MHWSHVSDSQLVEHSEISQTAVNGMTTFHTYHTGNFTVRERIQNTCIYKGI